MRDKGGKATGKKKSFGSGRERRKLDLGFQIAFRRPGEKLVLEGTQQRLSGLRERPQHRKLDNGPEGDIVRCGVAISSRRQNF